MTDRRAEDSPDWRRRLARIAYGSLGAVSLACIAVGAVAYAAAQMIEDRISKRP